MLEGTCPTLVGAEIDEVFVLLHDVYPFPDYAQSAPLHWIQCQSKVKANGDFLCSAVACIHGATYEVLVVLPLTAGALDTYEEWLLHDSSSGKPNLSNSGEVSIENGNLTVGVNHAISPAPPRCIDQS